MSKRDMQDEGEFFHDLFREASWPMRLGLILGIGCGVLYWFHLLTTGTFNIEDAPERASVLALVFGFVGLLVVGLIAGMAVGSILELVTRPLARTTPREEDEAEGDVPRYPKRRKSRRPRDWYDE